MITTTTVVVVVQLVSFIDTTDRIFDNNDNNDNNDNYKKDIDSRHKYSTENTSKDIQINISNNDNVPKKEIILNKEKRELVVILKNDKKD